MQTMRIKIQASIHNNPFCSSVILSRELLIACALIYTSLNFLRMKNITKNEMTLIRSKALVALFGLLLGALLLLPVLVSANSGKKPGSTKVHMHPLQKGKLAAITVKAESEGKYLLSIESEKRGSVYYNKTLVSPHNFAKIFDLTNLEDGQYTLKIKSRNTVVNHHFEIIDGKIKVNNKVNTKPKFNSQGNKALLELNNDTKLSYSLSVFDENGEVLFNSIEDDVLIRKVFDFSTIANGEYTIMASSNKNNYTFSYIK